MLRPTFCSASTKPASQVLMRIGIHHHVGDDGAYRVAERSRVEPGDVDAVFQLFGRDLDPKGITCTSRR